MGKQQQIVNKKPIQGIAIWCILLDINLILPWLNLVLHTDIFFKHQKWVIRFVTIVRFRFFKHTHHQSQFDHLMYLYKKKKKNFLVMYKPEK